MGVTTCFSAALLGLVPMEKAVARRVEAIRVCVCAYMQVSGLSVLLQASSLFSESGL